VKVLADYDGWTLVMEEHVEVWFRAYLLAPDGSRRDLSFDEVEMLDEITLPELVDSIRV
jgi:hypothetical protein